MAGHRGFPWYRFVAIAVAWQRAAGTALAPHVEVRPALTLAGAPLNENLATKNQAMSVWQNGQGSNELVVGLIHQYNDMDRRADDKQFAVSWESDGQTLREVKRVQMSCPDVELVVPSRGPFVYEARLHFSPFSLHPECGCRPGPGRACPVGVEALWNNTGMNLTSPTHSHFVTLENEWRELIADRAVIGRLTALVDAPVVAVSERVGNASALASTDVRFACPGSRDEPIGSLDSTTAMLRAQGVGLPSGHVDGSWCLVHRGGCSETAKVKVCELSGAVGTIIIDHGNFHAQGDQGITVRYNREALESATRPVIFVSEQEGMELAAAASSPGGARVRVGPSVAGPAPPGYTAGSGVIVHRMLPDAGGSSAASKAYPDIFSHAGWIEISDARDLLFVCIPERSVIEVYDVSQPLVSLNRVGVIPRACRRSGQHDYRILDYRDQDGSFKTVLIDPNDAGNRLYYYDTNDLSAPQLWKELQITWEASTDGLGQVRPGGQNGRYHLVTWHCSNLYCGKNHGDNMYVIDSHDVLAPALKVHLPMPTLGTMARDIACGTDHICLVSLTWDGLVAVDVGATNTVNKFNPIARQTGQHPFNEARIPLHMSHFRLWSGAQKVYASRTHGRRFYVEHADFNLRPLQVGDATRALQIKDIYIAEVQDYDPSVRVVNNWAERTITGRRRKDDDDDEGPSVTLLALMISAAVAVAILGAVLIFLLRTRMHAKRLELEMQRQQQEAGQANTGANVVVGRPVEDHSTNARPGAPGAPAAPAGPASAWDATGTAAGEPVVTPAQAKAQEP